MISLNSQLFLIPHNSATNLECLAAVSVHTPPASSPLWKDQKVRGQSRAAGTPHGHLTQSRAEVSDHSCYQREENKKHWSSIQSENKEFDLHCYSGVQSPSRRAPVHRYQHI